VAIVLEDIDCKINLVLSLGWCSAESVGAADLTLECGEDDVGVLARVRLGYDICVRWLAINVCGDAAVEEACQVHISESYGGVNNFFPSKLDPRVDRVEAFIEGRSRIRSISAAAEPRATWGRLVANNSPAVGVGVDRGGCT
jgi:hypothetical protein